METLAEILWQEAHANVREEDAQTRWDEIEADIRDALWEEVLRRVIDVDEERGTKNTPAIINLTPGCGVIYKIGLKLYV